MMSFLSALFSTCHQANVHMAIFYNGAKEAERFPAWVQDQIKIKQHVNQVIKHLTKRMTPPPKAFWVKKKPFRFLYIILNLFICHNRYHQVVLRLCCDWQSSL